jgi:hypothetical protein
MDMDKIKLILGASILFLVSMQVNATIISVNDSVFGANSVTRDTESGLEWLDLDLTKGMTLSSVLNTFSGWRLANKSQFQELFRKYDAFGDDILFGFSPAIYNPYNGSQHYSGDNALGEIDEYTNSFVNDFGYTALYNSADYITVTSKGFYYDGGAIRMGGLSYTNSSDPLASDSIQSLATWSENYSLIARDYGANTVGWFLYRESTIPEPSIIALFGLGLVGVGFARRRQS